jgi:curli biogenesis system outer membrane secretion channel CsgG
MRINRLASISVLAAVLGFGPGVLGQTGKPGAAAPAASPVDKVISLVKGGMSEALIIKTLQRQNQAMNLSSDDLVKLQKAGVSENIINAMMEPGGATAAAAVPVAAQQIGPACANPEAVAANANAQKRRLAVNAFDYSAVRTQVTAVFGNDVNVSQGIRALLAAKMGQSTKIVIVEREKLNTLKLEQDNGATNRFKRGKQAKIGQIAGADAYLFGDIVTFGRDDTAKKNNLSTFGRFLPYVGGYAGALGSFTKEEKAVVAINLRLVDTETSETIATLDAVRGESSRKSHDWGAFAGTWKGGAGADSGMTSSNFAATIIGEATTNAVAKIAAMLEGKVDSIPAKTREIEGHVINFDGCTLYISAGGNDGVQVGDRFEIHKILKDVIDPQTKEVLDQETVKVGEFVAGTVRDKVSIGQYGGESLNAKYEKGYAARLVSQ